MPRRADAWRHLLVLAPAALDLDRWPVPPACVPALVRDVLAGPPSYRREDPETLEPIEPAEWVERDSWPDGVHHRAPGLLRALSARFTRSARRSDGESGHGDVGFRIYLARPTDWHDLAVVAGGVTLARESGLWRAPEAAVVLRAEDARITAAVQAQWRDLPVRYLEPGSRPDGEVPRALATRVRRAPQSVDSADGRGRIR